MTEPGVKRSTYNIKGRHLQCISSTSMAEPGIRETSTLETAITMHLIWHVSSLYVLEWKASSCCHLGALTHLNNNDTMHLLDDGKEMSHSGSEVWLSQWHHHITNRSVWTRFSVCRRYTWTEIHMWGLGPSLLQSISFWLMKHEEGCGNALSVQSLNNRFMSANNLFQCPEWTDRSQTVR